MKYETFDKKKTLHDEMYTFLDCDINRDDKNKSYSSFHCKRKTKLHPVQSKVRISNKFLSQIVKFKEG
jgi:hypothetical protein